MVKVVRIMSNSSFDADDEEKIDKEVEKVINFLAVSNDGLHSKSAEELDTLREAVRPVIEAWYYKKPLPGIKL